MSASLISGFVGLSLNKFKSKHCLSRVSRETTAISVLLDPENIRLAYIYFFWNCEGLCRFKIKLKC